MQSLELLRITRNFLEFLDLYEAFSRDSGVPRVLGGPRKSWEVIGGHRKSLGGPELLDIKFTRKEQTLSFAELLKVTPDLLRFF